MERGREALLEAENRGEQGGGMCNAMIIGKGKEAEEEDEGKEEKEEEEKP